MKKTMLLLLIIVLNMSYATIPEMISVTNGDFYMGNDSTHHVILTNDFEMSKYEITNSEYCEMLNYALSENLLTGDYTGNVTVQNSFGISQELLDLDNSNCEIEFVDGSFTVDTGKENRPVRMITWYGSAFYCNVISLENDLDELYTLEDWRSTMYSENGAGYRLPTDAEWEFVARYDDGRTYPWGDETPTPDYANYDFNVGTTTDVGSYSPLGDSQLGFCDMAGNVFEWVNDYYGNDYPAGSFSNPTGPLSGTNQVVRGGSWFFGANDLTTTGNIGWTPNGIGLEDFGFRIVKINTVTDINDNDELLMVNGELKQNYPNPFNPTTKINYQLSIVNYESAEIVVHNAMGQSVWSTPVGAKYLSPGSSATNNHGSIQFDGSNLNSGIYYYSLIVDGKKMDTRSMVLIK